MLINREPERRELAAFGAVLPVAIIGLGVIIALRTESMLAPASVVAVGGAVAIVYLVVPRSRRPIFVGWQYVTYPIGWIVTHVLLLMVFWLVVVPVALLLRVLGRDPLARALDPSAPTYWVGRDGKFDHERYFKQF